MSVDGQPSVLYLRRIHSPSRYHLSRPCSLSLASTSASSYFFWSLMTPLHHDAAVDVDRLAGHELGLRRREEQRRGGDVARAAPALQRRALGDRAVESGIGVLAEARLDPPRREDVDAHVGREVAREALAEREHAALDGGEQLGVLAGHAGRDVIPAHVDDRAPTLAHQLADRIRAGDRALE